MCSRLNRVAEAHMSLNTNLSPPSAIDRPTCPKCGELMDLARIEPDLPDHDRRKFECSKCDHSETIVVKYK